MSGPWFIPDSAVASLAWPADSRVDTENWGQYLAQHYANSPQAQVSNYYQRDTRPLAEYLAEVESIDRWREMTAADLGLERDCYSGKCESPIFCEACDGCISGVREGLRSRWAMDEPRASDAPYSFWLGADTPRPDDFKASC